MEKLAREGDVRAEAWMGLMMQQASRRAESKEGWGRAAEKGNKWAIGSLASMHLMDKEDEKAAYWYRRGAELGYPESQASLASLLLQGRGVATNEEEAVRLYKAAAAQGYPYAYFPLAQLYAAGRVGARSRRGLHAARNRRGYDRPKPNQGPESFQVATCGWIVGRANCASQQKGAGDTAGRVCAAAVVVNAIVATTSGDARRQSAAVGLA